MPVFRELLGWSMFAILALSSLGAVTYREVARETGDSAWDTILSIGRGVEPLWIVSAIAVYTATEGWIMIAEAFKKKMMEYGRRMGWEEGLQEGRQAGRQEGRQEVRSALLQVIEANPDRTYTAEELEHMVDEYVQRNGAAGSE